MFEIMKARHRHAAFGIAAGLVLATGIAAVVMSLRLADSSRWVAHTLEVRRTAAGFLGSLQDAETGERGFLLTGRETFLEPYTRGISEAEPALNRLRLLTADNPMQQQLLSRLAPLVALKLKLLAEMIAAAREGEKDRAITTLNAGPDKEVMDNIRTLTAQFSQTELDLLTMRERAEANAKNILLVLILGSLAGASIFSFLAINSQRKLVKALREEAVRRETIEATLRQAQKMEAVGQLTGGIAHDFNNLLTIILGNLDTAQRRLNNLGLEASAAMARPIAAALYGTKSAAKLTHRLLAFSRQQPLEPVPLDMNKLIGSISELLRRTVGSPITLETVMAGGLWQTMADANQLENALINLVINAKDAMPEGGKITIETSNGYLDDAYASHFGDVSPGQYVVLCVTDNGTGIKPDVLDRVFEPFFTTKAGSGTGLGLAMIHGFAKQSGGHIRIYSEVGDGTTVKLYLPKMTLTGATAAVPRSIDLDLQPLARAKSGETILVVEDNEGVQEFASSSLEDLGYRVLTALDGPKALLILESEPAVDLLFTDIVMPKGMTGRQLADLVLSKRPQMPVLYTTGYTRNAIVHQGRLDANVHLLSKPYTQRDLAAKIRSLLDHATLQAAKAEVDHG